MTVSSAVRIAALIVGLGLLALAWLIGFVVLWGLLSGAFLSGNAAEPSWSAIPIAVLTYILVAALLFGERLR